MIRSEPNYCTYSQLYLIKKSFFLIFVPILFQKLASKNERYYQKYKLLVL